MAESGAVKGMTVTEFLGLTEHDAVSIDHLGAVAWNRTGSREAQREFVISTLEPLSEKV